MIQEVEQRFKLAMVQTKAAHQIMEVQNITPQYGCAAISLVCLRPTSLTPAEIAKCDRDEGMLMEDLYSKLGITPHHAALLWGKHKKDGHILVGDYGMAFRTTKRKNREYFRKAIDLIESGSGVAGILCNLPPIRIGDTQINHMLAIIGRLKKIAPELHKSTVEWGRKNPRTGVKRIRKEMVAVIDTASENFAHTDTETRIIHALNFKEGFNTIVVLKEGYKFDLTKPPEIIRE